MHTTKGLREVEANYSSKPKRAYSSSMVRAHLGNCSPATLYRRLADPGLKMPKPRKIGGTNLWDADLFDAWLSRQLDGSGAA